MQDAQGTKVHFILFLKIWKSFLLIDVVTALFVLRVDLLVCSNR